MPTITPFLWFDNQAEEAMQLYTSIFKNSKIKDVQRYPEGAPGLAGSVMAATIELNGQDVMLLNGGPMYKFNEAFSMYVSCETQAEIDDLWNKLTANGGEEGQCGWLKDKFGLSWQIIPSVLGSLLGNPDPAKAQKAMQAMLQMHKLDIKALEAASDS